MRSIVLLDENQIEIHHYWNEIGIRKKQFDDLVMLDMIKSLKLDMNFLLSLEMLIIKLLNSFARK